MYLTLQKLVSGRESAYTKRPRQRDVCPAPVGVAVQGKRRIGGRTEIRSDVTIIEADIGLFPGAHDATSPRASEQPACCQSDIGILIADRVFARPGPGLAQFQQQQGTIHVSCARTG